MLAWGYFLHQGVVDPLGGINTLWPLFGIANQMLAGMALMLCAVVLFKMKRQRYAWVALVPTAWLLICTLTAVVLGLFSIKTALAALKEDKPTSKETLYEPMPENVEEIVAQAKGAH